jgi:hypothetical protein
MPIAIRCHRPLSLSRPLALALVVLAAPATHATIFKCQGEQGVVLYQEAPCPIGKELRNFDTDPPDVSVIHGGLGQPANVVDKAKEARPLPLQRDGTAGKATGSASARRFVRQGMTEADVLAQIGRPDATAGGSRGAQARWSYLPAPEDPDTVTTITFAGGVVSEVSRKVLKR